MAIPTSTHPHPSQPRTAGRSGAAALLCLGAACLAMPAVAQVTLKPDGQWRYLFSAGANASSGNANTLNANLSADAAKVTDSDKWTWRGQAQYGKNAGVVTAQRYLLGTQYNRDLNPEWFGFGSADLLRDRPANLSRRFSTAGGIGKHIIKREDLTFDLSAGLGYSHDKYNTPTLVQDAFRDSYGRVEAVLAEESNHKLTDTTSLRQKLSFYPNLSDSGAYRVAFESGVSVAMTKTLNLTAGLTFRRDSDPGVGIKRDDATFVTGVSYRID